MSKIDRVISHFRALREEGPMGPTMNTSTPNGEAGYGERADATGSNAGFSGVLRFMRRSRKKKSKN
jgi:hypothetical protein